MSTEDPHMNVGRVTKKKQTNKKKINNEFVIFEDSTPKAQNNAFPGSVKWPLLQVSSSPADFQTLCGNTATFW